MSFSRQRSRDRDSRTTPRAVPVFRCDGAESGNAVRRYDAGQTLPKAFRTDEGYLEAPGTRVARLGVQEYTLDGGKIQRELRIPEEVFSEKSLKSLNGKPVVHRHPGKVDSTNARNHSRGVAMTPRQDGDFLATDLVVHDAEMIQAAERGESEISLGYDTVLVPIPGGVFRKDGHRFDGTKADFLQTQIVHNHVALLDRGRANENTTDRPVRLRLDGSGNQIGDESPKEKLVKITINGVEIDVPDAAAPVITGALAEATKAAEVATAKADAAEQMLNQAQAKADGTSRVHADAVRFELMSEAKTALRLDIAEIALLSNEEIRRKLLQAKAPEMKLDGKSDDYVAAALDVMKTAKVNPAAQMAAELAGQERNAQGRADAGKSPYEEEIRKREERRKNKGKAA